MLKPHVFEGVFVVPLYPQLLLLKLCLSRLHLQLNLKYNKYQDCMKVLSCSRAFPTPVACWSWGRSGKEVTVDNHTGGRSQAHFMRCVTSKVDTT